MASFGILFFFAVTGLTLNHADWFAKQQHTIQIHRSMDRKYLAKEVAKLEVVEHLRNTHGIGGAEGLLDGGYGLLGSVAADALIDRATGRYELTETRMGFFAILNDLHKGRDTGTAWAWIIDLSAVLMTLISLTGLLLIFFLQKKQLYGLLAASAGAVRCCLAYVTWVP